MAKINNMENLKNLEKIAKIFQPQNIITSEEIDQVLKGIMDILASYKKGTDAINEETKTVVNSLLEQTVKYNQETISEFKSEAEKAHGERMKELQNFLSEVKTTLGDMEVMMSEVKDGKDADEERVIEEVVNRIKIDPTVVTMSAKEVRDKLASLKEEDRLDKSAIKGLEKILQQKDLDYAIATLQQQASFLINKGGLKVVAHDASLSGDGTPESPLAVAGGGSGITLQTDGVANGSQTLLNLVGGTNVTLTDNGTGSVTIDATGGSGSPGGSTTQLQYNNSGSFGGISGATTDGTITTYSAGNLKAADVTASGSGGLILKNSGGTSIISVGSGGGTNATIAAPTNIGSNSADYIQIAGNTGSTTQTATGSSTDININLIPKGTGRLQEGGINVLNTNSVLDDLSNVQVSTPNTNDHLAWNGSAWIPVPTTQVVGSASVFYLDNTLAVADNKSLSITPSAYAETTNTASADADINGGVAFLERFVSGPLGRTTIPAGVWDFSTFANVSAVTGANFIETRINKRVEQTGMTATFTGAGATRTLTVTGGTPFVAGDVGDGTELTATLVETPNQTCWISGFTSSSQVTVTLTDSGYVNESGVSLSALYYLLFRSTSSDIASTGVAEVSYNTTQPEFTGLNATDRIVAAYFGRTTSATARNFTLYHGGSVHYSHFHSPLTTQHNDLAGLNNGDFKHLTSAEYTGTGTGNFVRATSPVLTTPNLGTPSALTLTNATGLPIAGLVSSTSTALGVGSIELGDASDTTLSRVSAGVIAVEGVTVATASNTLTLSGKTLTAPKFADLGFIADANGNEMIIFDTVASAVNEITVANAATGGNPNITASGSDSNIGLDLTSKGTGSVNIKGNSTQAGQLRIYEDTDDGSNYTAFKVGTQSGNVTYTLPTADGSSGQLLSTNGSGVLSWATGGGGGSFVGCRVYKSGSQSIGTTLTAVNFDAESFDTDTMHDNVTNNTRITFTTAGKYIVGGYGSSDVNGTGRTTFRLNGSTTIAAIGVGNAGTSTQNGAINTTIYDFSAGDYVEMLVAFGANNACLLGAGGTQFWAYKIG